MGRRVGRRVGRQGGSPGWSPGRVARAGRQGGSAARDPPADKTHTHNRQTDRQTRSPSRTPYPNAPRDQNTPFGHPLTLVYIYIYIYIYCREREILSNQPSFGVYLLCEYYVNKKKTLINTM